MLTGLCTLNSIKLTSEHLYTVQTIFSKRQYYADDCRHYCSAKIKVIQNCHLPNLIFWTD